MDRDYLVKITLALYRVSGLFPKEEPLRYSLREKANQILANSILFFSKNPLKKEQRQSTASQILEDIKVVQALFGLAQEQNWLKEENFFVLTKEYAKLEGEIRKQRIETENYLKNQAKQGKRGLEDTMANFTNERHKEILGFLRKKGGAQVRDLKEIFPDISKRTLRRDFEYLLTQNLVKRIGDSNRTIYRLR